VLCVLRDPKGRSGFFLTHQGRRILALPDEAGEPGEQCLRRFLFEILLHLQDSARLTWQPDLSAYLEVFGLDKFVRLQNLTSKLLGPQPILAEEVIEMVYLMGDVPGEMKALITDPQSVFMFKRQSLEDGTMIAEAWLCPGTDGRKRPISAKAAWEAARRQVLGEATAEDRALLTVFVAWFMRMKTSKEELVIKPEHQLW